MQPGKRKDGYTKEELEYLKEIAEMSGRTNKEITEMFNSKFNQNRTVNAIIGTKSRCNIKSYTRAYTKEQINYLRKTTPGRTHKEVRELFNKKFKDNRTRSSIKSILFENGIKTGNTGRFENGDMPYNWVPVGSERITKDGYIQVKIQEGQFQQNWRGKHILIWEKHHGSLPEGHAILFGDKNKRNFDVDNLILVSRRQLLNLNQQDLIQNNAKLTKTAIIITDLDQRAGVIGRG